MSRIAMSFLFLCPIVLTGCLFVLEDPDFDSPHAFDYGHYEGHDTHLDGNHESDSHDRQDSRRERDRVALQRSETIGPFSEGILAGPFFFTSGQIPRDPETGEVVRDDAELGTRLVLEGLKSTLEAVELGLEDVVKVTVFLKSMDDYATMNAVYAKFFGDEAPARSTVEVSALARDAVLEIDMIAVRR